MRSGQNMVSGSLPIESGRAQGWNSGSPPRESGHAQGCFFFWKMAIWDSGSQFWDSGSDLQMDLDLDISDL